MTHGKQTVKRDPKPRRGACDTPLVRPAPSDCKGTSSLYMHEKNETLRLLIKPLCSRRCDLHRYPFLETQKAQTVSRAGAVRALAQDCCSAEALTPYVVAILWAGVTVREEKKKWTSNPSVRMNTCS